MYCCCSYMDIYIYIYTHFQFLHTALILPCKTESLYHISYLTSLAFEDNIKFTDRIQDFLPFVHTSFLTVQILYIDNLCVCAEVQKSLMQTDLIHLYDSSTGAQSENKYLWTSNSIELLYRNVWGEVESHIAEQ
jgi:hypothetical protein